MTSNEVLIKWRVAQNNLGQSRSKLTTMEEALLKLEKDVLDWDGAKTLLEYLKNYKLEKRKDFILKIINSAMQDVFEEDYRLDILPREIKGKSAASTTKYDIIFYQNGIEIANNDELLTSNGGGVLSIASLFFKILIGYLYSKNKFFIFDEALSQVSPQYRERLSLFLKEFCERYDFTLVVVSQTEELEEHADLVYEVYSDMDTNGVPILKQKPVEQKFPSENFFYVAIKNFQSVVDQTFIFKGFTIIRGPNNSGKSATLRAIEALLFNNFKTDTYPRKNPGGKKLTTEITFGFEGKEGSVNKEIQLKYKSGKVMFVIEGEEYFGKNLAADKLKEAVEEIGFRYIDTKQMYKNFKGPLKEQTERIAYTSQYDGLFLIGAKTSDSEKIFSFLFNTENIALAIAHSKESLQEQSREHKALQAEILQKQEELILLEKQVKLYLTIYYHELIQEHLQNIEKFNKLKTEMDNNERYVNTIRRFLQMVESLIWMIKSNDTLNTLRNKIKHNNKQETLITDLLQKIQWVSYIKTTLFNQELIKTIESKNSILNKLIPDMKNIILADYWIQMTAKINSLRNVSQQFVEQEENLSHEYHLQICSRCKGIGVEAI
jgi:energy-coupling factor transporter ATP-binding protein EcfA2/nicotinamide mononucleotide adenylyltransferase